MTDLTYDLAVSFAGEHREYVESTVRACEKRGLRVFYDRDKGNDWWGGNFIRHQRSVYSSQTRYFVPFLSREYLAKPIPMDEFSAAMMTAVRQGDGYILPVLMDDVDVPPELLHPHIHYLRAGDFTPDELAEQLAQRVDGAAAANQRPMSVGEVVENALAVRLPRITPSTWSKYEALEAVFSHLSKRFEQGRQQLRSQGLACSVRTTSERIAVRVERSGTTVAGLDIAKGLHMGDDHITWSVGYRSLSSNSWNGWGKPVYDVQQGKTVIEVSDLANFGGSGSSQTDEEGFFTLLWDKIVEQVEQSGGWHGR